jgi:DNA-binding HxlR family transcriptional regulator
MSNQVSNGERTPPDGTSTEGGDPEVTTSQDRSRARHGDLFDPACPTRLLLDRVGSKWVAMVVKVLAEADPDELRFAALRRAVPGVSQKMLSQTLRELAADGLVTRRVVDTVPPQVHYGLTALGRSLDVPLAGLRAWAEDHMGEVDDHRAAVAAAAERMDR